MIATERAVYSTGGFNEVTGIPQAQITNEWWFPWYDNEGMSTNIMLANPGATATSCTVYVGSSGGTLTSQGTFAVGGYAVVPLGPAGLNTGPVKVACDNPIIASQRATYNNSFNEVMGIPPAEFSAVQWFAWYDNQGMATSIHMANPSASATASCNVYSGTNTSGGALIQRGSTYNIGPNSYAYHQSAGLLAGPALVSCTQPIIASARSIFNSGINEVVGVPQSQLRTQWWLPWYDNQGMASWIMIANSSPVQSVNCNVYVGESGGNLVLRWTTGTSPIAPNSVTPFSATNLIGGPVKVDCDFPVFVSQRAIYGGGSSFDEVGDVYSSPLQTFVYDDLDRLVGVIDPSQDTTRYAYDAVGNATSISRQSATAVSAIQFSPSRGAVGTSVTITGTGFSALAGQNTVTFNGAAATVTSATNNKIVAAVPSGATTGTIAVTVGGTTSTTSGSFTVTTAGTPTVTSFTIGGQSSNKAAPGTQVTINGTNFDTTLLNNRLTFGGSHVPVTSATSTALTVTLPAAATSGKVVVATPEGVSQNTPDFFVLPSTLGPNDVQVTQRISIPSSQVIPFTDPSDRGILIFDAFAGQRLSLGFRPQTFGNSITGLQVTIYRSDGMWLLGQPFGPIDGWDIDLESLPMSGTYTAVLDPLGNGGADESVTVSLSEWTTHSSGAIPQPGSITKTFTTEKVGQNGIWTFPGSTGQCLQVAMNNSNLGTRACYELCIPNADSIEPKPEHFAARSHDSSARSSAF